MLPNAMAKRNNAAHTANTIIKTTRPFNFPASIFSTLYGRGKFSLYVASLLANAVYTIGGSKAEEKTTKTIHLAC